MGNQANSAVVATKVLKRLYTFNTEPVGEFSARDNFIEGKTSDGVTIACLGKRFEARLLDRVERQIDSVELKVSELFVPTRDLHSDQGPGIIRELDACGSKYQMKRAHLFQLLAYKQRTKDFKWVITYISDTGGNLWTVFATWFALEGGWIVEGHPTENIRAWPVGTQIVSR